MIFHYYTLVHVARELQTLIGCRLVECFSYERNSLVMNFSDGINNFFVQYFGSPPNTSLFLKNNYAKPKKNIVSLFDAIAGEVLQSVFLHDNNRIIQFEFINTSMYFFLFGGSNSNIIVVNKKGKVIYTLKTNKDLEGNKFVMPESNLQDITQFTKDTNVWVALSKCSFNLGTFYAEVVLEGLNINNQSTVGELSESDIVNILKSSEEMRSRCLSSTEYLICDTEDGLLLTLIPLSKYPKIFQKFTSISDAISKRVSSDFKKRTFNILFKEISLQLERQRNRLRKNIDYVRDEESIIERAGKYKLYAELLLATSNPKIKSGIEITLSDYSGNVLQIPLDVKLTILDNANKYFDKSRNARKNLEIRKKRLPDLELKLLKIENALKELNETEHYKELKTLAKKINDKTGNKIMEDNQNRTSKFREFDLGEGYMLFVGKNAANNDELTMKFAKPNDLWFHARGSGGSHVVLRTQSDTKPPKYIIQKSASVAAYYSKARNAKYVPVAYTYKKYVRKPKGANVGAVVISKEEVIMVKPELPKTNE